MAGHQGRIQRVSALIYSLSHKVGNNFLMPTKKQSHRASKLKGRYAAQFEITKRNKARREAARKRRATSPAALKRKAARLLKWQERRAANLERNKRRAEAKAQQDAMKKAVAEAKPATT